MKTIPIQCSKGFGKPKDKPTNLNFFQFKQWDIDNTLPAYTPSGEVFLGEGCFEGYLVWQEMDIDFKFYDSHRISGFKTFTEFSDKLKPVPTRQIYSITEPIIQEEKHGLDLNKLEKEVDDMIASKTGEDYKRDFESIDAETAKAVASSPTGQTAVESKRLEQLYQAVDIVYPVREIDALAPAPDDSETRVDINEKMRNAVKIGVKHGFKAGVQQSTREREELIGSLKRLIDAAKPHCNSTSTLNMRVKESEELLTKLNLK